MGCARAITTETASQNNHTMVSALFWYQNGVMTDLARLIRFASDLHCAEEMLQFLEGFLGTLFLEKMTAI
jgi:hypothetical protein